MSCGSPACTSTTYDFRATKPLPDREWIWQGLIAGLSHLAHWHELRRQRRHLLELDERLLHDIGISRRDAVAEARKPLWIWTHL